MALVAPRPPNTRGPTKVGYGDSTYRAHLTAYREQPSLIPTRSYTGVGSISVLLYTQNLASRERQKGEKLTRLEVQRVGVGAHLQETRVEVLNLRTQKRRVVTFPDD